MEVIGAGSLTPTEAGGVAVVACALGEGITEIFTAGFFLVALAVSTLFTAGGAWLGGEWARWALRPRLAAGVRLG